MSDVLEQKCISKIMHACCIKDRGEACWPTSMRMVVGI